jgi:hypothetical protein
LEKGISLYGEKGGYYLTTVNSAPFDKIETNKVAEGNSYTVIVSITVKNVSSDPIVG